MNNLVLKQLPLPPWRQLVLICLACHSACPGVVLHKLADSPSEDDLVLVQDVVVKVELAMLGCVSHVVGGLAGSSARLWERLLLDVGQSWDKHSAYDSGREDAALAALVAGIERTPSFGLMCLEVGSEVA